MNNKNSPILKTIRSMPNPIEAERDYIECQILGAIFADTSLTDNLIFSGGATLSKSYNMHHRISRDLDLSFTDFEDVSPDRSCRQLQRFKKQFKEFVFDQLYAEINYAINQDERFMIISDRQWRALNNPEQRMSYPTLHVLCNSILHQALNHICIEIIPRKYIASAITHRAAAPYSIDASTCKIPTVAYQQTFWDKVFAIHSMNNGAMPRNKTFFSRHYFDVAQMADGIDIDNTFQMFNDTVEYQTLYTTKEIAPISNPADIRLMPQLTDCGCLAADYYAHRNEFLIAQPGLSEVITRLKLFGTRLNNYQQGR